MVNQQDIELLAPAGKWDVLTAVAEAGADAVYAGGKKFNMRMLRDDFNFCDEEIAKAVNYLHQLDKKLYITINNLYDDSEIPGLQEYLLFLQQAGVDAIIVQDMAVVELYHDLHLNIPLHASVQAGISNLPAVKMLEECGFSRVILSKNNSLEEIKAIAGGTKLGIEYFAHGDLCISHTGQCFMSSFLGGKSGNRGECMKPCRWQYGVHSTRGCESEPQYWLAHNDLCVYPYLRPMVEAGITSFKIEGRMRPADYLSDLIKIYRRAIDNLLEDRQNYAVDEAELEILGNKRVRDLTSGNLLNRPDVHSIGLSGEREPFFPTTAIVLNRLQPDDFGTGQKVQGQVESLSVKAGNLEAVKLLSGLGVDEIILGYDQMRPGTVAWTPGACNEAMRITDGSPVKILLESPRILSNQDVADFERFLDAVNKERVYAVIANDLGAMHIAAGKGFVLQGGYGLSITNSTACMFYLQAGLKKINASQELNFARLQTMTSAISGIEVTIQGPLCGMVSDFCILRAVNGDAEEQCAGHCADGHFLKDLCGQQYMIRSDEKCRNHIFYPYDRCLFPYLNELVKAGLKYWRIDGQYYDIGLLQEVTQIYINARNQINAGETLPVTSYGHLLDLFPNGLSASPVFASRST